MFWGLGLLSLPLRPLFSGPNRLKGDIVFAFVTPKKAAIRIIACGMYQQTGFNQTPDTP
jgi:hypothetical protein